MNAQDPLDAQSPSFNITPTLFVGSPPPQLSTSVVASSAEAVAVIEAGGSAVLPADRWDLADEVLVAFGASRARRASALMLLSMESYSPCRLYPGGTSTRRYVA